MVTVIMVVMVVVRRVEGLGEQETSRARDAEGGSVTSRSEQPHKAAKSRRMGA